MAESYLSVPVQPAKTKTFVVRHTWNQPVAVKLHDQRQTSMSAKSLLKKDARNIFSVCADACGESDVMLSAEKVPGTFAESTLLLVAEAI